MFYFLTVATPYLLCLISYGYLLIIHLISVPPCFDLLSLSSSASLSLSLRLTISDYQPLNLTYLVSPSFGLLFLSSSTSLSLYLPLSLSLIVCLNLSVLRTLVSYLHPPLCLFSSVFLSLHIFAPSLSTSRILIIIIDPLLLCLSVSSSLNLRLSVLQFLVSVIISLFVSIPLSLIVSLLTRPHYPYQLSLTLTVSLFTSPPPSLSASVPCLCHQPLCLFPSISLSLFVTLLTSRPPSHCFGLLSLSSSAS